MLMYCSESIVSLKVHWELNLAPSWTQPALERFVMSYVCHSLKGCVLPPSLLFLKDPGNGRKSSRKYCLFLQVLLGTSCLLFVKRDNNNHHRMEN